MTRRNRMDLWTPAERAIYEATQVVEQAGAHPLLTDAVTLLGQARDKVADFVDGDPVPRFICGPTCGCGSAFDMVPAINTFPGTWTLPPACPHCGQEQPANVFITRGARARA